jgi:uncharacterized protein
MKYLLLVLVVGVVLFLMFGRQRKSGGDGPASRPTPAPRDKDVAAMLACAHCGVHLPGDEAVRDEAGRSYCGEAHRLAGPR